MYKNIISILNKTISIALILATIFTAPILSRADELSDKQNQKEEIDTELSDIENEIGSTQESLDNTLSDMEKLEQEQNFQEETKKQIIESLESLQNDILELDNQILTLEKDLAEKEELFLQRAKIMYQYSEYSLIDLFFESENIFDFFDNLAAYKKILKIDRDLIDELTSLRNTLADKKELQTTIFADKETLLAETEKAIEAIKNDAELIQSDYETLTEALNQLAAREESLIQNSEDLQAEIDRIEIQQQEEQKKQEQQQQEQVQQEQEQEQEQQQEQQQNNTAAESSRPHHDSHFIFPLESYIYLSSPYGYRTHPITGEVYSFHTGMDFASPGGTPIYAAADGTVTVAVPVDNGGYGLWIEIQHSDGTSTRYAHCNDIYVKVGDTVKQGQTIAEVGTTGSSTGNHLHFEVLENGERQNPAGYVVLP